MPTNYNHYHMHPDDNLQAGVVFDAKVSLHPRREEAVGLFEADADLRSSVVAMAHGFGSQSHPIPNELFSN